jgi:branched-subunit amino acid transport protein
MTRLAQHLKVIGLTEEVRYERRKIIVALQRPCRLDVIYLNFLPFEPLIALSALMFVLVTLPCHISLACLKHLILNRVTGECST